MEGKKGQAIGGLKMAVFIVLGLLFLVILILIFQNMINTTFTKPN